MVINFMIGATIPGSCCEKRSVSLVSLFVVSGELLAFVICGDVILMDMFFKKEDGGMLFSKVVVVTGNTTP
jgi:hypothetical protein